MFLHVSFNIISCAQKNCLIETFYLLPNIKYVLVEEWEIYSLLHILNLRPDVHYLELALSLKCVTEK